MIKSGSIELINMSSAYHLMPKVSIITVCYNCVDSLKFTVDSIRQQYYSNIEYIIIDGESSDGSVEFIEANLDLISYWVSEPDKGIYDAMNKGIIAASGDWIIFMNAGDTFVNNQTLNHLMSITYPSDCLIIFGDHCVRRGSDKERVIRAGSPQSLIFGSQFCHQSALISLEHHKRNLFDINVKIVADFDFFLKSKIAGAKFCYANLPISCIEPGGVSDTRRIDVINGWRESVRKHFGTSFQTELFFVYIKCKELIKCFVKKFFFPQRSGV
jgi:glycosyltransferase involved in cell wall biosynthesis